MILAESNKYIIKNEYETAYLSTRKRIRQFPLRLICTVIPQALP